MLHLVPFAAGIVVGAAALRWVQRTTAGRPAPRPQSAHKVPVTDGETPAATPAEPTPGESA